MGISGSSDRFIDRSFFERHPLTCARELIGCELVWGDCSGVIVETEAYSAVDDEASHAFFRPSTRLFMAQNIPGTAYVYFNYGVHWMLNVLVKGDETKEASPENGIILIRAIEPRSGIELMQERRKRMAIEALCSGPGKLTQALGIAGGDHCRDLCGNGGVGFLSRSGSVSVESDLRIGISRSAHLPWRFLEEGSRFVSVKPTHKKRPDRNGLTFLKRT